jgi:putative tricarboxylic transport membrane protein
VNRAGRRLLRVGGACRALALAAAFASGSAALAQSWRPGRTVEIVVPSAPGGSNDKTARTVEKILHEKKLVGVAVTVVNKPGGGNTMTMNYMNAHAGDGHFLMIGTPTILSNHIVGSSALNYTDFTPIASLLNDYVVFAVRAESPVRTGRDLVERLGKDPKSVAVGFATALGSHNHIAAGLLMKAIGGDVRALKAVAFKGSAEAVTGVLGGHLDLVTTAAGNVAAYLAAGKLRVVGVAGDRRLPGALAAVPTWQEQGVNVVFGGWRAIMGPKGLAPAQAAYWENVLRQVVGTPEWKDDLVRNYWSDDFAAGAAFAADLKTEYAAMRSVLAELGLAR